MRISTPAKINLTLEILSHRPDGYHDLASWFIPVALYDVITIESAEQFEFVSDSADLVADETNLVVRALNLFRAATGLTRQYRIEVEKRIPIGAGLGGGSSDAAATLLLLNALQSAGQVTQGRVGEGGLPSQRLRELAAQLGSDVVFFLDRSAAWCTGRGEKIEPRSFPRDQFVCLFKPGFAVSTVAAYSTYAALPENWKKGEPIETPWGTLRNDLECAVFPKYLRNDLECAVFPKYPLLAEVKSWLLQQPETELALLAGSGSTTFAVCRTEASAIEVRDRFIAEFGETFWTFVGQLNPEPLPIEDSVIPAEA
jgi:4-diphosphocytidyl-2-C-methyl-D-erythritol kinase